MFDDLGIFWTVLYLINDISRKSFVSNYLSFVSNYLSFVSNICTSTAVQEVFELRPLRPLERSHKKTTEYFISQMKQNMIEPRENDILKGRGVK